MSPIWSGTWSISSSSKAYDSVTFLVCLPLELEELSSERPSEPELSLPNFLVVSICVYLLSIALTFLTFPFVCTSSTFDLVSPLEYGIFKSNLSCKTVLLLFELGLLDFLDKRDFELPIEMAALD